MSRPASLGAAISGIPPGDVRELLEALTLPNETTAPIRYSGEGNGTKTAAQILKQEFENDWAAADVAGSQLSGDETQWFVFRNALRAAVYMKRGVTTYEYIIPDSNGNGTHTVLSIPGYQKLTSAYPAPAGDGSAPHGELLFAGEDAGDMGHWVDNDGTGTQNLEVTTSRAILSTSYVEFFYHDGKQWVLKQRSFSVADATTVFQCQPPAGGAYMYAAISGTVADTGALTATVKVKSNNTGSTQNAVWAHAPVPNIVELIKQCTGIRVLGAISWLRNESATEFAAGKIVAATMSKGFPWSNIASGTNQISQVTDYYSGLAANGHYAFLTPDDIDDFNLENDIAMASLRFNQTQRCTFPLRERSPYITGAMAASTDDARAISLITFHLLEYESTSKLVERRFSSYTEDTWRVVIEIAKRIPHHHENKFHFDEIMAAIGRYGAPLSKMAAEVLKAFPQTAFLGNVVGGKGFQNGFAEIEGRAQKRLKM